MPGTFLRQGRAERPSSQKESKGQRQEDKVLVSYSWLAGVVGDRARAAPTDCTGLVLGLGSLGLLMEAMGFLEGFQEGKGQDGLPPSSQLQCPPSPPSLSFSPPPLLNLLLPPPSLLQLCSSPGQFHPGLGVIYGSRSIFRGNRSLSLLSTDGTYSRLSGP